jgi:uncharacterized small protein (DUF1192 family)
MVPSRRIGAGPIAPQLPLVASDGLRSKDISRLVSKGQDNFVIVVAGRDMLRFGRCRGGVTMAAAAGKSAVQEAKERMPAVDDEEKPKKKLAHEIGQDLTLLSAGELTDRISLLKDEIARLEADRGKKLALKSAADSIFKK